MRTRAGRIGTGLIALLLVPGLGLGLSGAARAAPDTADRNPAPLNLQPAPASVELMNGSGDLVGTVAGGRLGEWPGYGSFVDFGAGPAPAVYALNDRGHVVGDDAQTSESVFLWHDGRMTFLSMPGHVVRAAALNGRDQVVGDLSPYGEAGLQAFSWHNGTFTPLPTPAGMISYALDVNDRGEVLGMVVSDDWTSMHGAVWSQGRMTLVGRLDGPDTLVRAINNRGEVIGFSDGHPFRWSGGRIHDLLAGTGATTGFARAINDQGVIIGEANSRAAVWTTHGMRYLTPPGYYGEAQWVNSRGDIAGGMRPSTGPEDQPGVLFRRRSGVITYYGAPDGTTVGAIGLDDNGHLIGYVDSDAGREWVAWGAGNRSA